ncbi:cholinesterase 1-like [Haliotis rubra]|uniref:cholinesterase 1-like n=1 Tax=Haliotis rubra TaxID=36100 RepID=UPI001EE60333|nr:cholinesterase 1-like [Haliotis rubra]
MSSLSLTQDVSTTSGRLRGNCLSVLGKSVDVYHGVRFAKPPVGDLRFKHPVAFEANNSGITYAQVPGPSCIQPKIPFFTESFKQIPDDYSEDCLHLSIWTPTNNTGNLSVMIWVYGGGFWFGSGQMPLYDGAVLAVEHNVIVVTINYRLGPLGFAYLGPETVPGNMGLMDQRMAFKWVKTNVANFGGDPNRITIFGESAGALSVGLHIFSPLSRDTFDRAIMESGPMTESFTYLDAHTSKDITIKLAEKLKCPTHSDVDIYECLKFADAQSIADLQFTLSVRNLIAFAPVIDKYFLPDDPKTLLARGEYKNTELLHGFNKDEATLFVMNLVTGLRNLTAPPQNLTLSSAEYEMMIKSTFIKDLSDKAKEALSIYYKSLQPPGNVDYFDVVNNLQSDVLYNCPVVEFGSVLSRINPTFLYGFNHRISTNPFPAWTGTAHSFEIELVFGESTSTTTHLDAIQPVMYNLDASQPVMYSLDVIQPVMYSLDAIQPVLYSLDAIQPVLYSLDAIEPVMYSLDAGQPVMYNLDAIQPVLYSLDAGQPVMYSLDVIQPVLYSLNAIQPVALDAIQPVLYSLDAIQPVLYSLDAIQPVLYSLDAIQPVLYSLDAIQPVMYSLDAIQPVLYSLDAIQPVLYSLDAIQPVLYSLDAIQPVLYSLDAIQPVLYSLRRHSACTA